MALAPVDFPRSALASKPLAASGVAAVVGVDESGAIVRAPFVGGMEQDTPHVGQDRLTTPKMLLATQTIGSIPAFGPALVAGKAHGNYHGVMGVSVQDNDVGDYSFPCGIFGYGKLNSAGNQAFGIFGRVDLHSYGCGSHELNSFNYSSAPPGVFPPDKSFGISNTIPVCLTIAAGGDYETLIGLHFGREGSDPNTFVCGIYMSPDAVTAYGIIVDASSSAGPIQSANLKNPMNQAGSRILILQAMNSPNASSKFISVLNSGSSELFAIDNFGRISQPSSLTASTVGAAGVATVLPANPTGYLKVAINGVGKKIPYYED